MGRQQYIARLALGRSAYEPLDPEDDAECLRRLEADLAQPPEPPLGPDQYVQQFNSSGRPINPASRIAVREMIRAQNDVLATVGVCYGIPAGDKASAHKRAQWEKNHVESVMRENEVGLFIGAADLGVLFLANWWLDGIRHRVQVFKTFSDVSFSEMFWIQQKHYGLRTILFAGMPAHIAFTTLNAVRDFLQSKLVNFLHLCNSSNLDVERRTRNQRLIICLDKMDYIDYQSFVLIRGWVTKPDHPDPWSIKGAIDEDFDKDTIPGLGGSHLIGVGSELDGSDSVAWPMGTLRDARDWLMSVLRIGGEEPAARMPAAMGSATPEWYTFPPVTNIAAVSERIASADEGPSAVAEEDTNTQSAFQAGATESPSLSTSHPPQEVMSSDSRSVLVRLDPSVQAGSALEREGSNRSSEDLRDEHISTEEATGNQTGTGAEGVGLDILAAPPLFTNNITASPAGDGHLNPYFGEVARAWGQEGEHDTPLHNSGRRRRARGQKHRVTTLSSHPADVIASHMSSYLATWVMLPLETLIQRKIAIAFLEAAGTPTTRENAAFFLSEIYPPSVGLGLSRSMFRRGLRGGAPAGTMSRRGFISGVGYSAQLVITNLIQLLVSWTLFQVGYSGVTWAGKKWFRWGKL